MVLYEVDTPGGMQGDYLGSAAQSAFRNDYWRQSNLSVRQLADDREPAAIVKIDRCAGVNE